VDPRAWPDGGVCATGGAVVASHARGIEVEQAVRGGSRPAGRRASTYRRIPCCPTSHCRRLGGLAVVEARHPFRLVPILDRRCPRRPATRDELQLPSQPHPGDKRRSGHCRVPDGSVHDPLFAQDADSSVIKVAFVITFARTPRDEQSSTARKSPSCHLAPRRLGTTQDSLFCLCPNSRSGLACVGRPADVRRTRPPMSTLDRHNGVSRKMRAFSAEAPAGMILPLGESSQRARWRLCPRSRRPLPASRWLNEHFVCYAVAVIERTISCSTAILHLNGSDRVGPAERLWPHRTEGCSSLDALRWSICINGRYPGAALVIFRGTRRGRRQG